MQLILCRHPMIDLDGNIYTNGHHPVRSDQKFALKQMANRIGQLPGICGIVSSGATPSVALAEKLADRCGVQPFVTDDLREVNFGYLEGLLCAAASAAYAGDRLDPHLPEFDLRELKGESYGEVVHRQLAFLRGYTEGTRSRWTTYSRLVVIGHPFALSALQRVLCPDSDVNLHDFQCYTEIEYETV